jgi:Predicted solute binding protein
MKLLMGFIVLLVALVAITGCTQTASPSEQTTTETTAPVTTEVTTEATTVATTVATTIPTTTETIVANVTAPAANVTENVTETATVVPTATAANQVTTIHITNVSTKLGFTPQTDVVLPGTGITWVNDDNVTHSIKMIGNNTGMFTSEGILPGASYMYSFSENTGTFVYAFSDNQTVTGTIIVKKPCTLSGC